MNVWLQTQYSLRLVRQSLGLYTSDARLLLQAALLDKKYAHNAPPKWNPLRLVLPTTNHNNCNFLPTHLLEAVSRLLCLN